MARYPSLIWNVAELRGLRPPNVRPEIKPFMLIRQTLGIPPLHAASAALFTIALSMLSTRSQQAWAQVADTLLSRPWVRFTVQAPEGKAMPYASESPVHWLSKPHQLVAFKSGNRADFLDLSRQEVLSYDPLLNTLTLMTAHDEQSSVLRFLDSLLQIASSEGKDSFIPTQPSIQIRRRTQTEVQVDGHPWTEFTFQCRNVNRSPNDYQVIVRVHPSSKLPVELRSTEKFSADHPNVEWKLTIDYPESGPSDIYAMGVPRSARIMDRRDVKTENGEEIKKFLAAYRTASQKALRFLSSEQVQEVGGRVLAPEFLFQEDYLVADGLLPEAAGYPETLKLLSPVDNPDCKVTLDRSPLTGPPGTLLLHILIQTTLGSNDHYFWIAPDKDYLVLRYELHFSGKDHVQWHNRTRIIDKVEQSPSGRWYPAVIRSGRIRKHCDDLPSAPLPADTRPAQDRDPMEIGPVDTFTVRYKLTFD